MVDAIEARQVKDEILKTNFYCYLMIQKEFKTQDNLSILEELLKKKQCLGPVRALTKYHIAQAQFATDETACKNTCKEIIDEFIGEYTTLKIRIERSEEDDEDLYSFQYILYYCFLLLAYIHKKQHSEEESENYLRASKNMLKANNKSSQLINASSYRSRSSEKKHRFDSSA